MEFLQQINYQIEINMISTYLDYVCAFMCVLVFVEEREINLFCYMRIFHCKVRPWLNNPPGCSRVTKF